MKVLHVITGLESGGAENQLALLLPHSRHDSEVVALYNADGAVGRRLGDDGYVVHDLRMRSNLELGKVFELARLMRRGGYDVAHLHLYRATLYGRVAARIAGVPAVVTTEHSLGETRIEGRGKGGLIRLLYLLTEFLSDATIAVSPAVEDRLARYGVPEGKIRNVPNGLEFSHYENASASGARSVRRAFGIPEGAFVAGSVGRLHRGKRLDLLIEAFASAFASPLSEAFAPPLWRVGLPAYLVLVGDGPEKERLEDLALSRGVADRVVFAGERADVPEVLGALDLVVSLSKEETFGISVLEAVAAGRRVFADACPALDALGSEEAKKTRVRRMTRYPGGPDDNPGGEMGQVRRALLEARWGDYPRSVLTRPLRESYGAADVARKLDGLRESVLASRFSRTIRPSPAAAGQGRGSRSSRAAESARVV